MSLQSSSYTCPPLPVIVLTSGVSVVAGIAASFFYWKLWDGSNNNKNGTAKSKISESTASSTSTTGTVGSIFSADFLKITHPLYDWHMGCENMGPMLYALVRFVKSRKVLEIGAGYTSIYLLQALCDNGKEIQHVRREFISKSSESDESKSEAKDMYLDGYHYGTPSASAPVLHIMDNMEHESTTAHLVQHVASELGISQHLKVIVVDCFSFDLRETVDKELQHSRNTTYDFIWLDGITTDERFPALFDKYWRHHLDLGGYIAVHSTLTNTVTRRWMNDLISRMDRRSKMELARFEIMPSNPGTNMDELATLVRAALGEDENAQFEWLNEEYQVLDIGFGIQKLVLLALVDTVDTASSAAERLEMSSGQSELISSVEVSCEDSTNISSPEYHTSYLHYCSFLEPHKRFQNSFTIFQKRSATYHEPVHSWSP